MRPTSFEQGRQGVKKRWHRPRIVFSALGAGGGRLGGLGTLGYHVRSIVIYKNTPLRVSHTKKNLSANA